MGTNYLKGVAGPVDDFRQKSDHERTLQKKELQNTSKHDRFNLK